MDTAIQSYRRRMIQGEGSWKGYLRLMYRAGYSTGDALEGHINPELNGHLKNLVKLHLDYPSSANFENFVGAGRDIAVVESIRILISLGLAQNNLIITPASILPQWFRLFEQYAPELIVTRFHGNIHNKAGQLSGPTQVFLASYGSLSGANRPYLPGGLTGHYCFGDLLARKKWDITVIHEAHRIKNPRAKRSQFCYAIGDNSKKKIVITGCPVINRIEDIWGIFRFLKPDVLGTSYYKFMQDHFTKLSSPQMPRYHFQPIPEEIYKLIQKLHTIPGIRWEKQCS